MHLSEQLSSVRARAPSASSSRSSVPRYAPITPLAVDGHYLMRSDIQLPKPQSECSGSDSDLTESDDEADERSSRDEDATRDSASDASDNESDASDSSSDCASLSSRSASESSLYDSDDAATHDGLTYDGTSMMNGQHPRQRDAACWHSDNLGVVALLIPITGVSTMLLTELLACANHFDCSREYPTLSYAAEFKPEGHAFTLGMCTTALFIFASVALFHWFLRLKLFHPTVDSTTVVVTHGCLVAGTIAAGSLFGLAVFDMGAYHDAHITFTVLFFIFAWITMLAVQAARRRLLRDQDEMRPHKRNTAVSGMWLALQRWKRISLQGAFQLGQLFLYAGLTATGLFALLFLCVNGVWPNPLGFTAVQEALLEAFAIFCQLFFMGTLSCELSKLTRVVEHREYEELERAE